MCDPACLNGGACVQPDECRCAAGYIGATCGTRKFTYIYGYTSYPFGIVFFVIHLTAYDNSVNRVRWICWLKLDHSTVNSDQ